MSHDAHLADAPAATLLRSDTPDTGSGMADAESATLGEGMLPNATWGRDGMQGPGPMHLIATPRTIPADQAWPAVLAADGPLRPGRLRHHGILSYGSGLAFW